MKKITHGIYIAIILSVASAPAIANNFVESKTTSMAYDESTNSIVMVHEISEFVTTKVTETISNPSNRQRFLSEARSNPYSEAELDHPATANDSLSWESRTANCDSLGSYDQFYDCMFRPWNYGF